MPYPDTLARRTAILAKLGHTPTAIAYVKLALLMLKISITGTLQNLKSDNDDSILAVPKFESFPSVEDGLRSSQMYRGSWWLWLLDELDGAAE